MSVANNQEMSARLKSRQREMRRYFVVGLGLMFAGIVFGSTFGEPGLDFMAGDLEQKRFFVLLGVIVGVPFFMKSLILLRLKWSRGSHPHRIGLYAAIIIWLLLSSRILGQTFLGDEKAFQLFAIASFVSLIYLIVHMLSHVRAQIREMRARSRQANPA